MAYINFRRKNKKDTNDLLASALANRSNTNTNIGTVNANGGGSSQGEDWGEAANGLYKLGKGLYDSGIFSKGGDSSGAWSSAANNYISGGNDYGAIGNAINSNVTGSNTSGSVLTDSIGNEVNSGGSVGSNLPWGQIANSAKAMYNNYTGKSPEDYSDLEQSTIYPLQGAANGYSLGGPWGALGGALYGLGYSFKDDMGLKDSNFLTQLLYPIGMGDGGGLRIGGESILDIL